ncbi:hypothetical protein BJX65DRAFT_261028 [Aspergillus insuetus]
MSLIQVGATFAFYSIYHSAYLVAPTVLLSCLCLSPMALSKKAVSAGAMHGRPESQSSDY